MMITARIGLKAEGGKPAWKSNNRANHRGGMFDR